ncbi:MAG: FHA domain-containing protein, partial [Planctomycetota bacterium]
MNLPSRRVSKETAGRGARQKPVLRFLKGPMVGKTLSPGRFESLSFGRSEDADVVVPDAMASKIHCRLERREEAYFVVDHRSTNGTRLNGKPVTETRIFHDDVIGFGSTEIAFLCPEQQDRHATIHFLSDSGPGNEPEARQKRTDEMIRDLVSGGASGMESRFLHLLYGLVNLSWRELDISQLARRSLEKVVTTLEMHRGLIVDPALDPVAFHSPYGPWDGKLEPPLREILQDSLRHGMSIRRIAAVSTSAENADETLRAQENHAKVLCAPLRGPDGQVGAIYVDRIEGGEAPANEANFSENHLALIALSGRLLGMAIDRARLLEAKFLSEERYRVLVEKANDCIFLLDPSGRFDFANSRARPVLGIEAGELQGRSFLDLIPQALQGGIQQRLKTVLEAR